MPSEASRTPQKRDVTVAQTVDEPISAPVNPRGTSIDAAPHTDEIPNADPRFKYQWVRRDSLGEYLRPKRIGNDFIGYDTVAAWEVVRDTLAPEMRARGMDSQGSPMDSLLQHGGMVAIRLPVSEWEKHEKSARAMSNLRERSLKKGEAKAYGEHVGLQTGVVDRGEPSFMTHS